MTTKQEIIDRLDHCGMDMNGFLTIKQMIRDLKPKVKNLIGIKMMMGGGR